MEEVIKKKVVEEYSLGGEVTQSAVIELPVDVIHGGLIKDIGLYGFVFLTVIAAHTNKDGVAFPSYERIAKLTGVSTRTVKKYLPLLLDAKVDGQPLLYRKFEKGAIGKKSVYSFYNNIVEKEKADANELNTTGKILSYFATKYEEAFGSAYIANYGRDGKMIKEKLLGKFTTEKLKLMIDTAVLRYEKEWATSQYPRPSIGQITSWLGNKALLLAEKEAEKDKELEKRMDIDVDAYSKAADNLL